MGDPTLAAQYGTVLAAVPDATIVVDRLGRLVLVNPVAEALFGYGAGELLGRPVEALIPERFRQDHSTQRHGYFQDTRVRPMGAGKLELHGLRKDGSEFPAEISLSPLETDDGVFAVASVRDVTESRRAEKRFRALLEAAPDAMVIVDARGRIGLVNAQAERMFGYDREELLGQRVEALIPQRFRRAHGGHRVRYAESPRPRPMGEGGMELFGLRRDGGEFPVEISLSPLRTGDETLTITAIRDVSERRRQEAERARLHAELEQASDLLRRELRTQSRDLGALTRELAARKRDLEATLDAAREAHAQAERASRVKTDFLALVSHELRTPLALLQLQTEILSRRLGASRNGAAVRRLEAASRRLRDLVEALLQHSRLAGGHAGTRREDVELRALVEETVAEHQVLAEEKGLTLRASGGSGLPRLPTDPVLVRVVVSNLIGNALKFTSSGGVEVSLAAEGDAQVIRVSDTGPGIAEADRERIFQPFEQLDPVALKHVPGVGLGLALVRQICAALRAHVELRSELGAGSTFTIRLAAPAPEDRGPAPEQPPARA